MSREWQQTKLPEYVMPNAVYYQSIWAVRDLERMEERLKEIETIDRRSEKMKLHDVMMDPGRRYLSSSGNRVENAAMEAAILQERIDGIQRALLQIPAGYRQCVLDNIVQKGAGIEYPSKLWKIWKQKFLFSVAKNLSIM